MKEEVQILYIGSDEEKLEALRALLQDSSVTSSITAYPDVASVPEPYPGAQPHVLIAECPADGLKPADQVKACLLRFPDLPMICLSSAAGEEEAIDAIHAGATDYVLGSRLRRLIPALYRCLQREVEQAILRFTKDGRIASERLYHTLAESAQDMIYILDRNGIIVYVNSYAASFFHLRPEDLMGRPLDLYYSHEVAARLLKALENVFRQEKAFFTEDRYDVGGNEIWLSTWISPLREETGQVTAVMGITRDVTEAKRTEQALVESEARYRDLFENAPIGIFRADGDGRMILANRTCCEMLGIPCGADGFDKAGTPLPLPSLFDLPGFEGGREELLAGKALLGKEVRWKNQDDRWSWYSFNLRRQRNGKGGSEFEGTVEDVSDRKRAESLEQATAEISRALTASSQLEDLFREIHKIVASLMPADNLFIALYDPVTELISFPYFVDEHDSPPAPRKRKLGLTEWVLNNGQTLFLPSEERNRFFLESGVSTYGTTSLDWIGVPLLVKDKPIGVLALQTYHGTFRYRQSEAEILEFVSGQIALAIERRQAEISLRESEAKFRLVAESAGDAIITWNAAQKIIFWNRGATKIFGYSPEEVEGTPLSSYFPEFNLDEHARNGKSARATSAPEPPSLPREIAGRCKDGSALVLEINTAAWETSEGLHYTCFARDVGTRRKLEEQLRHSQKMEAVGRLAGGVAHDFNNMMTAIMGFSELISYKLPADDPIQADLNMIRDAGDRAVNLTRQLLAFSKRQIVQKEILNLTAILADMEKMFRRLLGENISLMTELAPDLGWIEIDHGQLDQVLFNLVVNAKDAMPDGGKLAISTANAEVDEDQAIRGETAPGSYVAIRITDTGSGIAPEVRAFLFEPFFSTKDQGSVGLGLAAVHGIIRQNGGFIEVESQSGVGTTFSLFLPRVTHPAEKTNFRAQLQEHGKVEGATILLVEDDGGVRALVKDILRSSGYRIVEADNGNAALVIENDYEGKIDLLLTDVIMPGITGAELAKTLGAKRPDMKILYMSGYTNEAIDRHGVLQEGIAFLQKPFTTRVLLEKVRQILHK